MLLLNLKRPKLVNIMDRRTALKNLGIGIGYTVATPTIFNILASCNAEVESWKPLFFSPEEKHIVSHLVDIILPTTETPGALDLNIPQFIDLIYHRVEKDENKSLFQKGSKIFSKKYTEQFNNTALKGSKKDFESLLTKYFSLSKKETKQLLKTQKEKLEEIPKNEQDDFCLYHFLLSVRRHTIFGYYTSEEIGEKVLAYDPIPGVYKGCIPLKEASQGKAWSLQ